LGVLRRSEMRRRFADLASQVGIELDPDLPAGQLPAPKQRLLEIMRALAREKLLVVMDEPSASLGQDDREHLQAVVRRLRSMGRAIVYISHDLDEVLELADRVTVMREGRIIQTAPVAEWTKRALVAAMLGRSVDALTRRETYGGDRRALLEVEGLTAAGGSVTVDRLTVKAGEIVGIGGLVGAGRSEFLQALAGADSTARGSLTLDGVTHKWPRTVPAALGIGIALVPEERQRQGLCLGLPARINVLLADLPRAGRGGWFSPGLAQRAAEEPSRSMGFNPARLAQPAGTLSGGNQQKLLLARWLHRRPKVLMLDEPTRGIDLGAKEEIFAAIRALADEGMGILLVSSDLEEVALHSDRVAVMARGQIVATLDSPVTVKDILETAFGVEEGVLSETLPTTPEIPDEDKAPL
jgi:ABC-type sugar transport system ATPase subunit